MKSGQWESAPCGTKLTNTINIGSKKVRLDNEQREETVDFMFCLETNLAFIDPVPTKEAYRKYYRDEFWSKTSALGQQARAAKSLRRVRRLLKLINKVAKNRGNDLNILEVGAGFGFNLLEFQKKVGGGNLYAVEPADACQTTIKQNGITFLGQDLTDISGDDYKFDYVLLVHVLEHFVDPEACLAELRNRVKVGGVVLIEVPDLLFSTNLSIKHPCCFSARSLSLMLANHGFRVDKVKSGSGKRHTPHLDIIATYLGDSIKARKESVMPEVMGARELSIVQRKSQSSTLMRKIDKRVYLWSITFNTAKNRWARWFVPR